MKNYIFKYIYHTMLAIMLLISSVSVLLFLFLRSTFIYNLFVKCTTLDSKIQINKDVLNNNYKILINYISNPFNKNLSLPNFPISNSGMIHFQEVKRIFMILFLLSILFSFFIITHLIITKKKDISTNLLFLRIMPIISFFISLIILLVCTINFETAFITFHKLLFKNDYWIFDPKTDPIINALPENFFLLASMFIIIPLIIESLILFFKYTRKKI